MEIRTEDRIRGVVYAMFCFSDAVTCRHCHHGNCPAECCRGLGDVNCVPKKAN